VEALEKLLLTTNHDAVRAEINLHELGPAQRVVLPTCPSYTYSQPVLVYCITYSQQRTYLNAVFLFS
jgi:hypothetical protein